jgi:SNF2 family DNA or RNA helicase
LNWLLRCWYTKLSSILADEMGMSHPLSLTLSLSLLGLGKTVQVVAFLEHLHDVESIRGPFLVCVPLSTIEHWKRETETWTKMSACLYHDAGGGRDMRDVIREYEWYYKGRSRRLLKFHVLITTYDDLIRDYEELAEIPWRVVVVDEAHRLRNTNSKLLECMRAVVSKGQIAYGYQHRILMTGTPLQNNTAELWSLLNFIEPARFPDAIKFAARYGHMQTQEQVESLQKRIAPHLLRRVKEDVAKDIPPKQETIIDVELTSMQKQYYRAIFEHNHGFLLQSTKGSLPKLMNIQMELRKCCNHPYLITGVEQKEMEELEATMINEMQVSLLPHCPLPSFLPLQGEIFRIRRTKF